MKRKAKQNGSGGRLRLGLFLASVAAFLLVPVAMASAAPVQILFEGSGSGTVTGDPFAEGSPKIECHWNGTAINEGTPSAGECNSETVAAEGSQAIKVNGVADSGSELAGWKVESGFVLSPLFCKQTPEAPGSSCTVQSFGEEVIIKVIFKKKPNVHISIEGEGSGTVVGNGAHAGSPPIDCSWNGETEELTGDCDALAAPEGPFEIINVTHEAAPGSVFGGWTLESGFTEGGCEPFAAECVGAVLGPITEVKINAKFDLFIPSFPLNVSTSGSGSGSLTCKIGAGSFGACPAEVKEGESVEVKVTPAVSSELAEWTTGPCTGESVETCAFAMPAEEVSANAEVNLKTFTLTLNPPIGEGTLEADCGGACPAEIPYGTAVTVTATPDALNSVGALTGAGSASACSNSAGPEEAATCEFEIKADSEVTAEFVTAASIATDPGNVEGSVDQQTTLETSNCDNVNVGPFVPSNAEEEYTNDECVVTVTATGTENELRAADEQPSQGATDETGHLTQEPEDPFTLNKALEVSGTGTTGGAAPSGFLPLSGTALLQDYGTPVSLDVVTVEFRQLIEAFEPLHTGTYDKVITLTLEQNVL